MHLLYFHAMSCLIAACPSDWMQIVAIKWQKVIKVIEICHRSPPSSAEVKNTPLLPKSSWRGA
jgi:hypothetical protein